VAIEPKKSWQILYNLPRRQAGLPAEARSAEATNAEHTIWLPLKDLFCNHKLEFDFSLDDLKIAFETLHLQLNYAYSN